MFFGDIVTITSAGVLAREKALQPLGIYDKSICWGLWAANHHENHPHHGHPNLIISPFHPSSWPFLIRLRLVLENRKGALAEAARLLEENDLSVVLAECTPTGFSHATWTVIAESTWGELDEARQRKEAFDFRRENHKVRIPPDESYYKARELANDIAAGMLTHVRRLQGVFAGVLAAQEAPAPGSGPPLFHVWSAEGESHFLYTGAEVAKRMKGPGTPEANREYIRSLVPAPAEVSYMQRLAYFSVYGGGEFDEVPFQFRYDAGTTLIKMTRGYAFGKGSFRNALNRLPMPAIATFNTEDKYLRLCPVTPSFLSRPLARIVVEYSVAKQPTHNAKASQGLLRRVCDALRHDVDLLHLSNKWTSPIYAEEEGEISFIAEVEPDDHRGLEERLRKANDEDEDCGPEDDSPGAGSRRGGRLEAVAIKDARVSGYPQKKLFLSFEFGHPRERCMRQLVERAAVAEGFMYVEVRTYIDPVQEEVDRQIRDCQALLQLLQSDADPSQVSPGSWIQYEYNFARIIDVPRIRLADTSKFDLAKWEQHDPVNGAQALMPFRLDLSDDDLYAMLREAIAELAKRTRSGRR